MLMRHGSRAAGTTLAAALGLSLTPAAASAPGAAPLPLAPAAAPPAAAAAAAARRAYNTSCAYQPAKRFRVGVLGATGAVGQRFLEHLEDHPWFTVTRLGASERSAGRPYTEAANWLVSQDAPAYLAGMRVVGCTPEEFGSDVDFVFSALVRGRRAAQSLTLPRAHPAVSPHPRTPTPRRTSPWRPRWSPPFATRACQSFPTPATFA